MNRRQVLVAIFLPLFIILTCFCISSLYYRRPLSEQKYRVLRFTFKENDDVGRPPDFTKEQSNEFIGLLGTASISRNISKYSWKTTLHPQKFVGSQVVHVTIIHLFLYDMKSRMLQFIILITALTKFYGILKLKRGKEKWFKRFWDIEAQVPSTKYNHQRKFFRIVDIYMNYGMRNDGQHEMSLGYYDVTATQNYQPSNQMQQLNGLANPTSTAGPSNQIQHLNRLANPTSTAGPSNQIQHLNGLANPTSTAGPSNQIQHLNGLANPTSTAGPSNQIQHLNGLANPTSTAGPSNQMQHLNGLANPTSTASNQMQHHNRLAYPTSTASPSNQMQHLNRLANPTSTASPSNQMQHLNGLTNYASTASPSNQMKHLNGLANPTSTASDQMQHLNGLANPTNTAGPSNQMQHLNGLATPTSTSSTSNQMQHLNRLANYASTASSSNQMKHLNVLASTASKASNQMQHLNGWANPTSTAGPSSQMQHVNRLANPPSIAGPSNQMQHLNGLANYASTAGPSNQMKHLNGLANPTSTAGPSQPHFSSSDINQPMEASSSTAHKYNLRRKRGPSVVEIDENDDEVQYTGDFLNSHVRSYGLPQPPPPQRSESNHYQQPQQQQRTTTTCSRGQAARRPQQRTRGSSRGGGRSSRSSNQTRLRPVAPRSNAQFPHGAYSDTPLLHSYGQRQRHSTEHAPAYGNQMAFTHANHQQYFVSNLYGGSNVIDLTQSQESPLLTNDAQNRNSALINYGASSSTMYQHAPANSVCRDNSLLYSQRANTSYTASALRNQLRSQPKKVQQFNSAAYSSHTTATATSTSATATVTSGNGLPLVTVKSEYNQHNYYPIKFEKMDQSTSTTDNDHCTVMFPSPKPKRSAGTEKKESYYPQLEYHNTMSNYVSDNGLLNTQQIQMPYCSIPANPSSQRNETITSQGAMAAANRNIGYMPLSQGNEGFNPQNINNDRKYTNKGMSDMDKYVAEYYLGKFEENATPVVPEHTIIDMELISTDQNAVVPSFNSLNAHDLDSYLNNLGKEQAVDNKHAPMETGMNCYENVMPAVYQPNVLVQPTGMETSQVNYTHQNQHYNNYHPQQSNNVFSARQGKCIIQNVQNNVTYNVHQGQYNANADPQNNSMANDNRLDFWNASTSQYVGDTHQQSLSLDFFNDTLMPWECESEDAKPTPVFDTLPQNFCQVGAQFSQAQNVVNHNYFDMSNYGPLNCQQNLPPVTSIKANKPNQDNNTFPAIEPKYPENEYEGIQ